MHWHIVHRVFHLFEHWFIIYVGVINATYFLLMVLGYFALRMYNSRLTREEQRILLKSPLLPEIGVVVPAYNEALTIRESVQALLNLHYPNHEVIVVNDGSTDNTLDVLIQEFRLKRSWRTADKILPSKPLRGIYQSLNPIRLTVVDKENGGKADALNAGLNVARSPLVAAVDSDSLLEEDALLQVVKPFLEDPERVLASGGIIRVLNGCHVEQGKVTHISTPKALLPLLQAIEYLRAFLGGRVAFSFLNSLLLVSGAFGVFRRDALTASGGFATATVGEDMEVIVRLHHRWRQKGADYRIAFVPEPVCWTQVPERWKVLYHQRNRWQRGTVESLGMHKNMLFNPRFGSAGLFAVPYFSLFEMFGPAVELGGYIFTIVGLLSRLIQPPVAVLFFVVSVLFGTLLSMGAVVLEEFTMKRYPSITDLMRLLGAAVLENFGYRQMLTAWRAKGLWDALRGKKSGWGLMERRRFQVSYAQSQTPRS